MMVIKTQSQKLRNVAVQSTTIDEMEGQPSSVANNRLSLITRSQVKPNENRSQQTLTKFTPIAFQPVLQ